MKIIFDVMHLYYLPQYMPVAEELVAKQHDVTFLFHLSDDAKLNRVSENVIATKQLNASWVNTRTEAKQFYQSQQPDWVIFGNAVDDLDELHKFTKTALMQHGIGPKSCYYEVSENQTSVRFIEGQHRLKRLQSLYPDGVFVDTGYAKLDPIINDQVSEMTLEQLGLDPSKKTLLYAPTFYPSSIEKLGKSFAKDFANYNIIVKPHFFSLTKGKYAKQRALLEHWNQSDNVYLAKIEEVNLVPFMALADLLMSDASSAIFEFAALQKPVVWCDFYQLRWSYRGIFKFRFTQRLDSDIEYFNEVATRAASYKELLNITEQAFNESPEKIKRKAEVVEQLAGIIDGQCSNRIVDYLEANK